MLKSTLAAVAAVFALSALSPVALAAKGDPHVLLTTSAGNIELELNSQKAPISVKNFVDYVNSGFYNNTTFHRVIPGFMIQGGGFNEQMQQKKPNPPIKNEADNGLRNTRGTIAMARTADKDSATSQFFINVADNAFLDHGQRDFGYAVFGKVVKGMDVADKISQVPTHDVGPYQNVPTKPVVILSAKVLPKNIPARARAARVFSLSQRNLKLLLILVVKHRHIQGGPVKKLTDKQKSRFWEQRRNVNFQQSRRLEGIEIPLVTLTADEALARLDELRRHYER